MSSRTTFPSSWRRQAGSPSTGAGRPEEITMRGIGDGESTHRGGSGRLKLHRGGRDERGSSPRGVCGWDWQRDM